MKKKLLIILTSLAMAICMTALSGCNDDNPTQLEMLEPFTYKHVLNKVTITGVKDKSIKNIVVPNFVTNIAEGAFSGCYQLEQITVPFIGEKSVEPTAGDIRPFGHIFGRSIFTNSTACFQNYIYTNNKGVVITDAKTFYIPTSLKKVTVTASKYIHDEAFKNITAIESVILPNSIEKIGDNAFYNSSIESITIASGVKEIGQNAFFGCANLKKVVIDSEKDYAKIDFNDENSNPLKFAKKLYKNNAQIVNLDLTGVSKISPYAFFNCESAKSVTVSDSLTEVGQKAFDGCSNLVKTTAQSVEGWLKVAFNGYSSNPAYNSENLFIGDDLLTELVIPSDITAVNPFAFRGCKSIISLTIHSAVTSIGEYAFFGCEKLFEVYNYSQHITLTKANATTNGGAGAYALVINTTDAPSMYSEENGFITATTELGKTLIGYSGNAKNLTIPSDIEAIVAYALYPNADILSVTVNGSEECGVNYLPKALN